MMSNVVVGIDGTDAGLQALRKVVDVGFASPSYTLVYAVESPMPDGSFPSAEFSPPLARWLSEREDEGVQALREAVRIIPPHVPVHKRVDRGSPHEALTRAARETNADLVVVGHNRRGRVDDLLFGSTARRLLHACPQNVMIVRGADDPFAPDVAVFATDNSPDSARCLETFLRLSPKGLRRIELVTVNEVEAGAAAMLVRGMPHLQHKAETWVERGMFEEAEGHCRRLRDAGYEAEARVVSGEESVEAIVRACDKARASLLILASPCHGFWDRLFGASVSEGVFERDARSLLVLRP